MKQLKFMLAAATAIGLASAAQAGYLSGSTDFETGTVESLFTYNGEPAVQDGDNESEIADGAAVGVAVGNNNFTGDKAKKLKVNTGTTPILRSVNGSDAGEPLANGNIYIDTLVKFTVTPNDDEPAPVEGDKLLIYLKEDLSDAANPKTNLVAQAGFLGADGLEGEPYVLNANKKIEANTWYRLTVTAYANAAGPLAGSGVYYPAFSVKIDNVACVADKKPFVEGDDAAALIFLNSPLHEQIDKKEIMLSLDQEATISFVGFAGEGEVDDLVISTFDPAKTVVDFTLALAGDLNGVSGDVTYTTSLGSDILDSSASTVYCYSNDQVTVTYTPVKDYTATWSAVGEGATAPTSNTFAPVKGAAYTLTFAYVAPTPVDFTYTFTLGENVSSVTYTIGTAEPVVIKETTTVENIAKDSTIVVTATAKDWYKINAGEGTYTVTEDKNIAITATDVTSSDIVVPVPGNTDSATVNSILAWAKAANKTTTEVEEATTLMANYLLDVTELTVAPKIEIVSIDVTTKPVTITAKVTDANGTDYEKPIIGEDAANINASIKYKAAATLEALKNAAAKDAIGADDKFVQVVVE